MQKHKFFQAYGAEFAILVLLFAVTAEANNKRGGVEADILMFYGTGEVNVEPAMRHAIYGTANSGNIGRIPRTDIDYLSLVVCEGRRVGAGRNYFLCPKNPKNPPVYDYNDVLNEAADEDVYCCGPRGAQTCCRKSQYLAGMVPKPLPPATRENATPTPAVKDERVKPVITLPVNPPKKEEAGMSSTTIAIIVGCSIGGLILIIAIVLMVCCLCCRKSRKPPAGGQTAYYGAGGTGGQTAYYGAGGTGGQTDYYGGGAAYNSGYTGGQPAGGGTDKPPLYPKLPQ